MHLTYPLLVVLSLCLPYFRSTSYLHSASSGSSPAWRTGSRLCLANPLLQRLLRPVPKSTFRASLASCHYSNLAYPSRSLRSTPWVVWDLDPTSMYDLILAGICASWTARSKHSQLGTEITDRRSVAYVRYASQDDVGLMTRNSEDQAGSFPSSIKFDTKGCI